MTDRKADEYDFKSIETRWQQYWRENGTFETDMDPSKPKYYILEQFPYPSGSGLHMGNGRAYLLGDILAKYHRIALAASPKPTDGEEPAKVASRTRPGS